MKKESKKIIQIRPEDEIEVSSLDKIFSDEVSDKTRYDVDPYEEQINPSFFYGSRKQEKVNLNAPLDPVFFTSRENGEKNMQEEPAPEPEPKELAESEEDLIIQNLRRRLLVESPTEEFRKKEELPEMKETLPAEEDFIPDFDEDFGDDLMEFQVSGSSPAPSKVQRLFPKEDTFVSEPFVPKEEENFEETYEEPDFVYEYYDEESNPEEVRYRDGEPYYEDDAYYEEEPNPKEVRYRDEEPYYEENGYYEEEPYPEEVKYRDEEPYYEEDGYYEEEPYPEEVRDRGNRAYDDGAYYEEEEYVEDDYAEATPVKDADQKSDEWDQISQFRDPHEEWFQDADDNWNEEDFDFNEVRPGAYGQDVDDYYEEEEYYDEEYYDGKKKGTSKKTSVLIGFLIALIVVLLIAIALIVYFLFIK